MTTRSPLNAFRLFFLVWLFALATTGAGLCGASTGEVRAHVRFSKDWVFRLVEASGAENPVFDDAKSRKLDLPHDCRIEQTYDPAMAGDSSFGYLPGGIGTPFSNSTLPTKQLSKGGRKMEKWGI
jgi:hypothetical protein